MRKYFGSKGQSLTEFALLLSFVACIAYSVREMGMLDSLHGVVFSAGRILGQVEHYRDTDVSQYFDDILSIQDNGNYSDTGGANHIDYQRGMMRSGWVDRYAEDAALSDIVALKEVVGASQWTLYTGVGRFYKQKPASDGIYVGEKGMFWTVQDLTTSMFTPNSLTEGKNWSKELVLQYFYSTVTGKYYVVKSYVWVNQKELANGVALGGLHLQHGKPAGYFVDKCVDGFDTLLEARELFERVRKENGGSVIFDTADTEHDMSAKDHLF